MPRKDRIRFVYHVTKCDGPHGETGGKTEVKRVMRLLPLFAGLLAILGAMSAWARTC